MHHLYRRSHRSVPVIAVCLLPILLMHPIFSQSAAQTHQERLAILDLGNHAGLEPREVIYLTDLIRGAAREQLPVNGFVIMTRENIVDLLGDRALSDCLGDCAVQTGRNLGARYVVSGEIIRFGSSLRLSVTLHETVTGNLLETEQAQANEIEGLEAPVRNMGHRLLQVLRPRGASIPLGGEASLGGGVEAWNASGTGYTVVRFESEPSGAIVEVDGIPICETPCSQALPAASVEVSFKLLRYIPSSNEVSVTDGMAPVRAILTPNFGWLSVTSDPPGLTVELDGESVGVTPVDRREVGHGLHEVWVRHPYRHDEGERVIIERGEHKAVFLEPVPINGGLRVEVRDRDGNALQGDILIDGQILGQAWMPLTVQAGPREVECRGERGRWRETVIVPAAELLVIEAELGGYWRAGLNSIGVNMIRIPAGSFMRGSRRGADGGERYESQQRDTISRDFLLSATEVTQAQYEAVIGENPARFKGAERPVDSVSWFDAVNYCNDLSEAEGLMPAYRISGRSIAWDRSANGYRLPTEVEWEYACRAGTRTRYHSGDDVSDMGQIGWSRENAHGTTHPVRKKRSNRWGLYDMHGNVWEWCWEWYRATDDSSNSQRVVRGGGWCQYPRFCGAASRDGGNPRKSYNCGGFRIARSIH